MSKCAVEECERIAETRGWCGKHYQRWQKYGDPVFSKYGKWRSFIDSALVQETDQCILWPFSRLRGGYGKVVINDKTNLVSRIVCEKVYGPPPSQTHQAAHSCQNPPCINKRHLRWATPKENQDDRLMHGTHDRRGRGKNLIELRKIDMGDIASIRVEYANGGSSQRALAKKYNISQKSVFNIVNGPVH